MNDNTPLHLCPECAGYVEVGDTIAKGRNLRYVLAGCDCCSYTQIDALYGVDSSNIGWRWRFSIDKDTSLLMGLQVSGVTTNARAIPKGMKDKEHSIMEETLRVFTEELLGWRTIKRVE